MSFLEIYGIQIEIEMQYVEECSVFFDCYFFFVYYVWIFNVGSESVQFMLCYWVIIDVDGQVEEVCGFGVVGECLVLFFGVQFEYMSYCLFKMEVGLMYGVYQMVWVFGDEFEVIIVFFIFVVFNVFN